MDGVWRPRVILRFGVEVCLELIVGWDYEFDIVNLESLVTG